MKKRIFSLIIVVGMLLGTFSIASAGNPQPVGAEWCTVWMPDTSTWTWYSFPGEGTLVYSPNRGVWNLSCHAVFDYYSVAGSWEDFCAWIPGSCDGSKMVLNKFEYYHDIFDDQGNYLYSDIGFMNLKVNSTGEAFWNAQVSYKCWSGFDVNTVSLELPPDFWSAGTHEYSIEFFFGDGYSEKWSVSFQVNPSAPLYRGQVRLGRVASYNWEPVDTINPAQDTFMQVSAWGPKWFYVPLDYAIFTIDGGDPITVNADPTRNLCTFQNHSWFFRHFGPKF